MQPFCTLFGAPCDQKGWNHKPRTDTKPPTNPPKNCSALVNDDLIIISPCSSVSISIQGHSVCNHENGIPSRQANTHLEDQLMVGSSCGMVSPFPSTCLDWVDIDMSMGHSPKMQKTYRDDDKPAKNWGTRFPDTFTSLHHKVVPPKLCLSV